MDLHDAINAIWRQGIVARKKKSTDAGLFDHGLERSRERLRAAGWTPAKVNGVDGWREPGDGASLTEEEAIRRLPEET